MASRLTLPTTLGAATIPQPGGRSRISEIDTGGLNSGLIDAANIRGNGLHKTAAGLQDVANSFDKLQLQQDQKEAKDALNNLMNDNRTLLYGDGTDANPGYYNLKGDAAVKASKTISAQLQKNRDKYLGQVSNKQVGRMYDGASTQLIQPDLDGVLKHANEQHLVAMDATDAATIDTFTNNLAANPTNDQNVIQSKQMIAQSVLSTLDRKGITDQVVRDDEVKKALSGAYTAAVRTALVRDPKSGSALYAKWKGDILGTDQSAIEQDIVQAEDRQMRKQEHAAYMQEHALNMASSQAEADYSRAIVLHASNPSKYPDVDLSQIGSDKRLNASAVQTLFNMQKAGDKQEALPAVSAKTLSRILPDIMRPYGDPKKITDYGAINQLMGGQLLNKSDWQFAANLIDQGRTVEGQRLQPAMAQANAAATQVIGKPKGAAGIMDTQHAIKLQQWQQWMGQRVEQYQQENKDPYTLFDPKNPDYVLSPSALAPFQIPFDESVGHMMDAITGGDGMDNPAIQSLVPTNEDIPYISGPDDPAFQSLKPGDTFYTTQNGQRVKGTKKAGNTISTPPVAPTAPSGD